MKKTISVVSCLTILGVGTLGTFAAMSLKISSVPSPNPKPKPKDWNALMQISALAARAGIQSTENKLSPVYVMNYYGRQQFNFQTGVKEKIADVWDQWFGTPDWQIIKPKINIGIKFDGHKTPYPAQSLNLIDRTIAPLLSLLKGGFSAAKALIIKGIADGAFPPDRLNVNTKFLSRPFWQKIALGLDTRWADHLTYDQIWTKKIPLLICNFVIEITKWPEVTKTLKWTRPDQFNLEKDNYNDHSPDPKMITTIHQLMRILVDGLLLKKNSFLKPLTSIAQDQNVVCTLIRLALFFGSYFHQFLKYNYSPSKDDHLFRADKPNNWVHIQVARSTFTTVNIDFQEISKLISFSLVVKSDKHDYLNKLKIWNILFDNRKSFDPDTKREYRTTIGKISSSVLPNIIPIKINWTIENHLPVLEQPGQIHGFDYIWHAFTNPFLTQLLVSEGGLQRKLIKKISFMGINLTVKIEDTWLVIQHLLDHLNVDAVPAQLLNRISQNDNTHKPKEKEKKHKISDLFDNYGLLIQDVKNLIHGKNFEVKFFGSTQKLALDSLISDVKKFEPMIDLIKEKINEYKTEFMKVEKSHASDWDWGWFNFFYQKYLKPILTKPLSTGNDPLWYYWKNKSVSDLGKYLSHFFYSSSGSDQPLVIKLDNVKKLINNLIGEPASWSQKHPDIYNFKGRVDLKTQTMIQYALRLWQEKKPINNQKVGIDAAFQVLGLHPNLGLEPNSLFSGVHQIYQGGGVDQILTGGLKLFQDIKSGCQENEKTNYEPLLSEDHYKLQFDEIKPIENDRSDQEWLLSFMVDYYRSSQLTATARYHYVLHIINGKPRFYKSERVVLKN